MTGKHTTRKIATVSGALLIALGASAGLTGSAASAASSPEATTSTSTDVLRPASSGAAKADAIAACLTTWSGRRITTNCAGVGVFRWRQWALCSVQSTHFTSQVLTAPPNYVWGPVNGCPSGQNVVSGGVVFY
jgi:hypothetical protein